MMLRKSNESVELYFCPTLSDDTIFENIAAYINFCEKYSVGDNVTLDDGDRITISYFEDKSMTFFKNDEIVKSFTNVINRFANPNSNFNGLAFGCPTVGPEDRFLLNYWNGGVDSLILFSRGLTQEDLQSLHSAERNNNLIEHLMDSPETTAYWNLGEDPNDEVVDAFNLRHGVATNVDFVEYPEESE